MSRLSAGMNAMVGADASRLVFSVSRCGKGITGGEASDSRNFETRRREQKLCELGEDVLLERERIADKKLKEARSLLAEYNSDRHAAAKALQAIDQREQAAKGKAARGKAAA
jgi:hypothetical protein